jgi:regulatory protein
MRPRRPSTQSTGDIHEIALRVLGRRALSVAELVERLGARGFDEAAVRAEVARLGRAGLLDDEALAKEVCREQLRAGRGRRAVVATLKRRRVAKGAAAAALEELAEGDQEGAALAAAIARATSKHRSWRRLPEERRKVIRYLLARGFGLDEIRRALEEKRRDDPNGEQTDDAGDPPGVP